VARAIVASAPANILSFATAKTWPRVYFNPAFAIYESGFDNWREHGNQTLRRQRHCVVACSLLSRFRVAKQVTPNTFCSHAFHRASHGERDRAGTNRSTSGPTMGGSGDPRKRKRARKVIDDSDVETPTRNAGNVNGRPLRTTRLSSLRTLTPIVPTDSHEHKRAAASRRDSDSIVTTRFGRQIQPPAHHGDGTDIDDADIDDDGTYEETPMTVRIRVKPPRLRSRSATLESDEQMALRMQTEELSRARPRLRIRTGSVPKSNDFRDAGLVTGPQDSEQDDDDTDFLDAEPHDSDKRNGHGVTKAQVVAGPGSAQFAPKLEVDDDDDLHDDNEAEDEVEEEDNFIPTDEEPEDDIDEDADDEDFDTRVRAERSPNPATPLRATRSRRGLTESRIPIAAARRPQRRAATVNRRKSKPASRSVVISKARPRRQPSLARPSKMHADDDDDDDNDDDDDDDSDGDNDLAADLAALGAGSGSTCDSSDDNDVVAGGGSGVGTGAPDYSKNPMADSLMPRGRYVRRRSRMEDPSAQPSRGHKQGPAPTGIEPIQVDLNLSWDDIGGLDHHIRALKEMVFLPLLYPEVFEKFKMEPPKGVLFYGPPGTGKTLCARALAASCGAIPIPAPPESSGGTVGLGAVAAAPSSAALCVPESARVSDIAAGNGLVQPPGEAKPKPRVAFFMRNGADCLSKWVGEAERQLRMTFEAAKKHQPSIIFFDEIDGLAPVRSARQDQIHSSIVSTLLGLMDGLDARGQIVVIGATNRVDSVDPALRRPGRFDRELIFTLPNGVARRKILGIHTSAWKPAPPSAPVLDTVAKKTVGYCGADLRALCSEAALRALRRRYPQIYQSHDKLVINVDEVLVKTRDFVAAMKEVVPASHRSARTYARPVPPRLACLLNAPLSECIGVLTRVFPQGLTPSSVAHAGDGNFGGDSDWSDDDHAGQDEAWDIDISRAGKQRVIHGGGAAIDRPVLRPRLLVCGRGGLGQTQLGPALLQFLEGCPVHAIDLPSLFSDGGARSPEEALVTAVREACRTVPSILYLPHLQLWWQTAHEVLRTTLTIALRDIPAELPMLVLATAEDSLNRLPAEVSELFADIVEMDVPSEEVRMAMFAPLCKEAAACPAVTDAEVKRRRAKRHAEVLPKAPPPVAKPETEAESAMKKRDDDRCIRDLRMEMRAFTERLMRERKFRVFWSPVDKEEVPDYFEHIANPIAISTIVERVDNGCYPSVLAMVKDFDLLVKNAISYNPAGNPASYGVLRQAHALVDLVHTWVDNLDPALVERCNAIVAARLSIIRKEYSSEVAAAAQDAMLPAKTSLQSQQNDADVVPVDSAAAANGSDATAATDNVVVSYMEVEIDKGAVAVDDGSAQGVPAAANGVVGSAADSLAEADDDGKVCIAENADEQCIGKARNIVGVEDALEEEEGQGEESRDAEEAMRESVAEEPFVPADDELVVLLGKTWLEVTKGYSVDSLDALHVRCSSLLFDSRRSRNRSVVVKDLLAKLEDARQDMFLKLAS
jgi:SpoVK/Ycf46/Vps4 family AAA+-type ATPase